MAHSTSLLPFATFSKLLLRSYPALKFPVFALLLWAFSGCGADHKCDTGAGPRCGAGTAGTSGASGTAGHSGSMAGQGDSGSSGEAEAGTANAGVGGKDCECGAAGESGAGGDSAKPRLDLKFANAFVIKAAPRSDGSLLVLLDEPLDMRVDSGSPQRELLLLDAEGRPRKSLAASTSARFLLDFAVHPGDDVSVLYSSASEYSLERFDTQGDSVGELAIADTEINEDPPTLPGAIVPVETLTRDAGRIAAFGEQVVVATRTGRHSVLTYRFSFFNDGAGATYHREWRTLAVPPFGMSAIGLKGGSYDTFSAVQAQAMLHLAVDQLGTIYVAVQHPRTSEMALIKAYAKAFGETLVGDADAQDLYVTRIDSSGTRVGTTVVGTAEDDQLFGLRAGEDSVLVMGRKEYWNEQGTGFDALVAQLHGQSGALELRELDVKRSDLAFDAAELADGTWLVTGASDWDQNPSGASVSEQSQAFLHTVTAGGETNGFALANGPRHNEGRTLRSLGSGRWLIGGMTDGPGTHSGDADASQVRASGFLRVYQLDGVGAKD